MIRVYDSFYEAGFTLDGEKNRIMIKKDGETLIEMTFSGEEVVLKSIPGEFERKERLHNIFAIGVKSYNPPVPAVHMY